MRCLWLKSRLFVTLREMKVNLLTSWHFWTLPASFRVKAVVGQIWILKLTRWIWVVFLFNVSFLCLFLGLWSLWSGLFELGFLWIEVEIYSFTSFSFTGFEKKHFSLEMVTKLITGQIRLLMFCLLNPQTNACEPNPKTTSSDFNRWKSVTKIFCFHAISTDICLLF